MPILLIKGVKISTPLIDILKYIKNNNNLHGKLATIKPMGDNIRINCPFHKNGLEKRPSSDVYIGESNDRVNYGDFNCFTCGEACPFYHLVAFLLGIDDDAAKEWLIETFSDGEVQYVEQLPDIPLRAKKTATYLNESLLNSFENFHPYMNQRKLTKKVIETFEIKYDPSTKSLVFPVRDEYGKLYMLTKRSVMNKTFIIDKSKEKPIYLMYFLKQNNIKEATLVESQINALTLWGWGIPSICSFGCNISNKQIEIIKRSGIKHLYVCYDGDEAGIHGTLKVIKALEDSSIFVDVIDMDIGKDVNDISFERFNQLPIYESTDWEKRIIKKYGKQILY